LAGFGWRATGRPQIEGDSRLKNHSGKIYRGGKKWPRCGNSTIETAPQASNEALVIPDDTELLRQVAQGDQAAFRALVDRHARYLHGVAFALVNNAADAEDIVQETFIAVLKGNFRGESAVRTWLVQILIRRAGMLRRSRGRQGPHVSIDASAAASRSGESGSEAKLDLTTMLAALSPEHRAVIVLRELERMSYEEMATALDVPRGTVESRLHRAREELRRRFKGYL
jgi:RNA polymerase sigma-70 factor (ECF subfamily)